MMKKILKIQMMGALLLSAHAIADTQNSCDELTGCKKKICHIKKNIDIAKKMENTSRVKGLQISLEKATTHCTDEKLIEDLEDKIEDTKKDLQEDNEDYKKAVKEQRADKIEKYKTKMSEENIEIEKLEQELKELQ